MQWGDWCSGQSTCTALPASLAANGNKYLLTFNEPDNSSQSNMTVARALQLWPYLEATGLELSSPAVTSSSTGTAWLASFMAQARAQGLRVDFIAAHWYGDCSNPQNLISYLTSLETYGLPIWLTEFSCLNDSLAENTQFFTAVAPLLAALPSAAALRLVHQPAVSQRLPVHQPARRQREPHDHRSGLRRRSRRHERQSPARPLARVLIGDRPQGRTAVPTM